MSPIISESGAGREWEEEQEKESAMAKKRVEGGKRPISLKQLELMLMSLPMRFLILLFVWGINL